MAAWFPHHGATGGAPGEPWAFRPCPSTRRNPPLVRPEYFVPIEYLIGRPCPTPRPSVDRAGPPLVPARIRAFGGTALDHTHDRPRHLAGSALRAFGVFAEAALRVTVLGPDGVTP